MARGSSAAAPGCVPGRLQRPAVDTRRWRQGRLATTAAARPAIVCQLGPQQRSANAKSAINQQSAPSALQQAALRLATAAIAAAVLVGGPVAAHAAEYQPQDSAPAPEYSYNGKELFAPMAYSGRWYEVASLKKGFAGEGQADCHCTQVGRPVRMVAWLGELCPCDAPAVLLHTPWQGTAHRPPAVFAPLMRPDHLPACRSVTASPVQGIYVPKSQEEGVVRLEVNTFCVHGGPGGRVSGIQARPTPVLPGLSGAARRVCLPRLNSP